MLSMLFALLYCPLGLCEVKFTWCQRLCDKCACSYHKRVGSVPFCGIWTEFSFFQFRSLAGDIAMTHINMCKHIHND